MIMVPIPVLIANVGSFLFNNKRQILPIVLGAAIAVMGLIVHSKTKTIGDLQTELELMRFQSKGLETALQLQNDHIQQLIQEGEAQQRKVLESQKLISRMRLETERKIDKLKNEQIGATCSDTMNWMVDKVSK